MFTATNTTDDPFTRLDADLAAARESLDHQARLDLRCEARTAQLEAGLARLEAARGGA